MDGSGGQGSIAWYIVVLCFSSQWALTLVMYVLLGNYRVWELLPVTRRYQHMQADTWHLSFAAQPSLHRWPCLLFLFLFKIAFFYLLHGGWLCCVTNQPTFYVAVCPICQVALQDCDPPAGSGNAACGWPGCTGCRMGAGLLGCLQGREQCRTYSRWAVFLSCGFRQLLLEVAPVTLKDGHILRYLNLFCSVFPNWFWCIAFILSLLLRICNWLQLQKAP